LITSGGERAVQASSEEPWPSIASYFRPPARWEGDTGKYKSPLVFHDGSRAETPADWNRRRAELLAEWTDYLGKWPPLITDPEVEILETEQRGEITQQRIRFRWTPDEFTTAYLLIPPGDGPHPGVVTVYYEPESAVGLGKENRDYAWALAQRGFAALSIG